MPPESRGIAPPSFGGAGLPMSSVACWCDGSVSERRLGNRLAVDSGQRDLDFSGARQGGRLLYGTSAAVACLERPTWLPSEAGIDTASQALGSANLNTTFSIYVHIGRQRPGVGSQGRIVERTVRCANPVRFGAPALDLSWHLAANVLRGERLLADEQE